MWKSAKESVRTAYRSMFKILCLPPVQLLMLLLATWKFPFSVADAVVPLKLQDFGVKKEHMAYIASGMMPAARKEALRSLVSSCVRFVSSSPRSSAAGPPTPRPGRAKSGVFQAFRGKEPSHADIPIPGGPRAFHGALSEPHAAYGHGHPMDAPGQHVSHVIGQQSWLG